MPTQSAAIVGAGVAGLTLALALAKRGIRSDILEQAETLTEVGAGLQISPNASRILADVGVLDRLRPLWLEPESVDLRSGISLKTKASVPMGAGAEQRWKAPYGVLHRATLQAALLQAVEENALCTLHLGIRIEPKSIREITAQLSTEPDVVVGADGVWSKCRALIAGAPSVRFSGNIAWRFVLPFAEAPSFLPRDRVVAFMAPGAHLVCYPLRDGGGFNLVAITSGMNAAENWGSEGEPKRVAALRSHFDSWHPQLRALIDRHQSLLYWPLCEAGPGRWHDGQHLVLIGDAAHAMMPFMAQGAAMAIEDAEALARHLATSPVPAALDAYDAERRPRIVRLGKRADFNRMVYHARGPLRLGRDLALALKPANSYMADFDWLYGYGG